MTDAERDDLKRTEEAKRDRHVDAADRWRMAERLIAWADAERPVPRSSKQGCLAAQRRLLELLGEP